MATASVTTSTTTTTTTLPNGVISQESSRGDIINTNESGTTTKNNITTPGIVTIFPPSLTPNQISFSFNAEEQTREELSNGYVKFLGTEKNLPILMQEKNTTPVKDAAE